MELAVIRLLAAEARAAGRDPGADPIPGLTRDLLFAAPPTRRPAATKGIGWVAEHRPELAPRRRRAERGRRRRRSSSRGAGSTRSRSPRRASPSTGSPSAARGATARCRARTTPRCSPPRPSAACAVPGPTRLTPVMARFLERPPPRCRRAPPERLRRDRRTTRRRRSRRSTPSATRCTPGPPGRCSATRSRPDIIHAGVKYNVIPGEAEIDRRLPGPARDDRGRRCAPRSSRRLGDDLAAASATIELVHLRRAGRGVRSDHPLYELLEATIREHDPDGVPLPVMPPFATDAKHMARLGVPTLRLLAAAAATRRSDSSSGSTASTSGSRSTPSAGACRSSTTSCAGSAAERSAAALAVEQLSGRLGRRPSSTRDDRGRRLVAAWCT